MVNFGLLWQFIIKFLYAKNLYIPAILQVPYTKGIDVLQGWGNQLTLRDCNIKGFRKSPPPCRSDVPLLFN